MTDLVLGARFDVTGDDKLVGQLSRSEVAARGLEDALEDTGTAADGVTRQWRRAGTEADQLAIDTIKAERAARRLGSEHGKVKASVALAAQAQVRAGQQVVASTGAQRAGYQQLGFQMQDVFQQAALGVNPLVILAQQGGQTASAIAMMGTRADGTKSRFVSFASFLSGPWGAALFGAATIVGFMVQAMLSADDAAKDAEAATYDFADGLDVLSLSADQATGAMKQLAQELRGAIAAQGDFLRSSALVANQSVSNLEGRIAASSAELRELEKKRGGLLAAFLPSLGTDGPALRRERELRDQVAADRRALIIARQAAADGSIALAQQRATEGLDPRARARGEFERAVGELNRQRRATVENSDDLLYDGVVISEKQYEAEYARLVGLRDAAIEAATAADRKGKGQRGQSGAGQRAAAQLARFGEGAEEKVQRMLDQYAPTPRALDKSLQDLREIDRLIADLEKRRPPDFAATIASAEQARAAIQAGLADPIAQIAERFSDTPRDVAQAAAALGDLDAIANRLREIEPPNLDGLLAQIGEARVAVRDSLVAPFREIIDGQERSIALLQLAVQGRHEEAEQLTLIHALMRQVGAESTAQLATELARRGVSASMLEQMLANLATERALSEEAGRRLAIQREHLREVDAFRGSIEQFFAELPRRGLKALGDFAGNVQRQTSDYLARYLTVTIFGGVFRQIEDQLSGRDQVRQANQAYVGEVEGVVEALRALEDAAYDAAAAQAGEIRVEGRRDDAGVKDPFDFRIKSPRELFGEIATPLLEKLGLGPDLAKRIGESVGVALEGAAYGQAASASILGSKGNSTTAAIGGALGQVAGEELGKVVGGTLGKFLGPLGGIAGGVLGGLVGGLFQKAQFGTASLSGPGDMSVQGRGDGRARAASSLGGSVQSALAEIADALDAEIGAFRVSIGTYKDRIKVSTSGRTGSLKNKYGDVVDFRDDQAGALAFAIADAIGDGAIKGVSAAVQRALRSSEDIQQALKEALAVREVEDILGGVADEWRKELRAFEKMAQERLRIGRDYGFDLIELEKRNAEDRAKLLEGILDDRVGSLRRLLEDLTFGNLAEGSLAERRTRILDEIGKAEAGAEKGDAGAADRLAELQRQLLELSFEAFGTAGSEYGSDRDQAIASAERIIKLEEERVKAAQAELTTRLDTGNALASETNNLLAQINANLQRFGMAPSGGALHYFGGAGLETERMVAL